MLLAILLTPINAIQNTLASFKVVGASTQRVFRVVSAENTVRESPSPVQKHIEGDISFEDVSFGYGNGPVLKQLNFHVAKGEIAAIVGPSGAGKTTLINLIMRFYDPGSGSIRVDGIDIRNYSLRSLRSQIGVVTQNTVLFNESIADNIRYAKLDATRDEIVEASKMAHAFDFIRRLPEGFDTVVGERGALLSGGEKQRLSIARAILRNPRVLILDEATSALDSESEHYVQEALARLMVGRTSVVIAHRLATVRHAHTIHVLDGGAICASGKHEYLLENSGLYSRLCALQQFR
jgi:subfamily B ATP-binding cassette protein MsbA